MRFHRPRDLNTKETADTLDHWISSFEVYIKRDPVMAPFLIANWNPNADNMGQADAAAGNNCELFLAHLASFMTVPYHKKTIMKRTTSLESVWHLLRGIYNVEKSAETLLDIGTLAYDKAESYASFYHKIVYYIEMNLCPEDVEVNHVNSGEDGDEISITLLDMAALLWINKIDARLYDKIKVDYAVQIKNGHRLSQLVPTIAKALPGMLKSLDSVKREVVHLINEMNLGQKEDIDTGDTNTQIFRVNNPPRRNPNNRQTRGGTRPNIIVRKPICSHCNWLKTYLNIKEIDVNHPTSSCSRALPTQVKAIIEGGANEESQAESDEEEAKGEHSESYGRDSNLLMFQKILRALKRVQPPSKAQDKRDRQQSIDPSPTISPISEDAVRALKVRAQKLNRKAKSPKILVTIGGEKTPLYVDEGSELNCIDGDFASKMKIRLAPSSRTATAAGNGNLTILGESESDVIVDTKFQSHRVPINLGRITVIKDLGAPIILGEPGKCANGISTDPKNRMIFLEQEGRIFTKPYFEMEGKKVEICRIESGPTTLFPGDHISLPVPEPFQGKDVMITPRREFSDHLSPRFSTPGETISIYNSSTLPINIKKHAHIADIRRTSVLEIPSNTVHLVHDHMMDDFKFKPRAISIDPPDIESIRIDPDGILTPATKMKFYEINKKYSHIFTTTPLRYSGAFGDCDTSLNFTTKPVQTRKVHSPNYSLELNKIKGDIMDEMYAHGVLATPEELGISLEYMSPSLIVPKPGGGWRFVTDFTELNKYIRPFPSSSPTMTEAKRDLSQKKYFCELDLTSYFHQGGLRREDCAWLGVQHPTRGPMCYTSSPQGLKNSSEFSYDRLARVFGPMIRDKKLTRMADGVFVLGDSEEELLQNYVETLERASMSNLSFKPSKTVIAPRSAVIFGWQIRDGEWTPQEHVVSSLCRAELPNTVKQLRSFNGAVKQLSEAIPQYAELLHPLEKIIGARGSAERITWTPELKSAFEDVKTAIRSPQGIHIPRASDKLETYSDFSKLKGAVGGMMMIVRKDKSGKEVKLLGGHFSAKVGKGRSAWMPCDGEALAVKLVLEHFQNQIRESQLECTHFTDSMPVVQAARRLITGRFSNSSKITAFLTTIATLPVRIEHRPGSSMKIADHASRNPPDPCKENCQICKFVEEESDIGDKLSIFKLEDNDDDNRIMESDENIPFLQLKTWLHEQRNCPVHAKLMALIRNGQPPEKKKTGGSFTTLKHLHTLYTRQNLKVHKSGVIMVRSPQGHFDGFAISVPEHLFHGIAFQFHHRLSHPKKSQLTKFLSRYFFVTALPAAVEQISSSCLQCLATVRLPKALIPESTSIPKGFGTNFSCDVLERAGQVIFVAKEEMSQFVSTIITEDQTTSNMRDALIQSVSPLINIAGAVVKLDAAPAFQSLEKSQDSDPLLKLLKIRIKLGHSLNKNHNAQAENSIAELKRELLSLSEKNQPISKSVLAIATRNLNSRIRSMGRSAWEFVTSRDGMTSKPFSHDDEKTLRDLTLRREKQHEASEKHNSKSRVKIDHIDYHEGDIVMYRDIENYDAGRDTFIVVKDHGDEIEIRKFKKQMRLKTYRVKREQIVLIFSPTSLTGSSSLNDQMLTPPASATKPTRQAALKSTLRTKQMSVDKLLSIKHRKKKDHIPDNSPGWIYLYSWNDEAQQQVNFNDDENDDFNDDENDESTTSNNDQNNDVENSYNLVPPIFPSLNDSFSQDSINQDPDDYGTPTSTAESVSPPSSPTSGQSYPASIETMSPTSRHSLERHFSSEESTTSLDWDNNSLTVNLSDPFERSTLFSIPSDSESDSVFEPDLFVPPSPPSPYLRVTRRQLRDGTFIRAPSDSSTGPESPFLRNNPLRRPTLRVRFSHHSPEIIRETRHTTRNNRQTNRQRLEPILESDSN